MKICPYWGISSFLPLVVTNLPFLSLITVFGDSILVATFPTYDNVTITILDPLFIESALNTHCAALVVMMALINQGVSSENSHILFCAC